MPLPRSRRQMGRDELPPQRVDVEAGDAVAAVRVLHEAELLVQFDQTIEQALGGGIEVGTELREGLNNAYRQLRELLTTFRLQIHDAGLVQELKDTAEEFSRRGEFQVHLHVDALAFQLSASEQIHLLQVTREALSNCLRHAHAENAWLQLRQHGETVSLSIEDDGRGFSEPVDQREHHGLTIADIDHARVFPRPADHLWPGGMQGAQPFLG